MGTHDHRGIVWDEFVAMLLVLSCVPQGLGWWLLSFLLFRLFDILKPQPVKWADSQIKGGLGVMLDDAIAAVLCHLSRASTALVICLNRFRNGGCPDYLGQLLFIFPVGFWIEQVVDFK